MSVRKKADLIAHFLWRLLPPAQRQNAYELLTTSLAPRAATRTGHLVDLLEKPVVVVGPLSAPTGLGASARLVLDGLLAIGCTVSLIDLSRVLRQPSVAGLPDLPPARPGEGTVLLCVQPPSVGHALLSIPRSILAHKFRVGFWMWELELLPFHWRRSNQLVNAVASPSRFAAAALSNGLGRPTHLLSYPLALHEQPDHEAAGGRPFTVGLGFDIGSTVERKNPFAAVDAFMKAFPDREPVRLLIKLRGESSDPNAFSRLQQIAATSFGRVEIVSGDLDAKALDEWWRQVDVLISLHRSEGFGLFPAEAMMRGKPVISTDWSSTAEFIDAQVGWPIRAELVPAAVQSRYGIAGARWADADVDQAAKAIREAWTEFNQGNRTRGLNARSRIQTQFSLNAFKEQWRNVLAAS